MKRNLLQRIVHPILQNCAKPEGTVGKLIVKMMNASHEPLAKWGITHLELPPDAVVIDLGCGGGSNVSAMLEICPNGRVTGFDYSTVSVKASKRKNADAIRNGRCEIIEGDVGKLPFEDNSFDAATAFETVYFWPEKSFHGVHRILKPGGKFLIVCEADGSCSGDKIWPKIIDGMKLRSKDNLIMELQQAGFHDIQTDQKSIMGGSGRWLCVRAEK
ncbi:MAG: class I SAM-dependent methyltransferase [Anaerovibrio sp.]|uniref:class I SAM-dependent methyltransferase n=1 Tax=Anaerovibrio sp. TaxID=1872532 RepID=UPI0025DD00D1|nr:class I SAM-dependent methyltransferase [Anaerovibrio sp.]MCR5176242.1 class I SAM-dependent methyltransferase [Anaerovibrio sp.]